eukprot:2941564-Prymnesium_polylepis.1
MVASSCAQAPEVADVPDSQIWLQRVQQVSGTTSAFHYHRKSSPSPARPRAHAIHMHTCDCRASRPVLGCPQA